MKHISPGISTPIISSPTTASLVISSPIEASDSITLAGSLIITGSILPSGSLLMNGDVNITGDTTFDRPPIFLNPNISVTSSWADNAVTASYAMNGGGTTINTGSFVTTSSFNNFTSSINSVTSSFITTGSSNTSQTISGSLIINQNLTVLGSASITYVSQSTLNVGTNLITVNTSTPAVRFGGLAVYDSGSTGTGKTGSLLWDSQNDVWVYSNPSGAAYDGALILVGPRNTTGLGNEVGINSWYAAIGNGSHHMTSSAIYNSGSLIRLETDTQITGSLTSTGIITGPLDFDAANIRGPILAMIQANYTII